LIELKCIECDINLHCFINKSIENFRQQGIGQKLAMTGELPKTQVLKEAGIKHHERYGAIADIPGKDFTL
jgi:hypothetical protein